MKECPEPESNQRHADFQSAALPTELSGLNNEVFCYHVGQVMTRVPGYSGRYKENQASKGSSCTASQRLRMAET